MRKTIRAVEEVEKIIYVCDNCGKESNKSLSECIVCERELCDRCRTPMKYNPLDYDDLADDLCSFYLCQICNIVLRDKSPNNVLVNLIEEIAKSHQRKDAQLEHIKQLFKQEMSAIKAIWKKRSLEKIEGKND